MKTRIQSIIIWYYLSTLPYDGLRGRRVGLRPHDGGGGALVPAVALPEGSLRP